MRSKAAFPFLGFGGSRTAVAVDVASFCSASSSVSTSASAATAETTTGKDRLEPLLAPRRTRGGQSATLKLLGLGFAYEKRDGIVRSFDAAYAIMRAELWVAQTAIVGALSENQFRFVCVKGGSTLPNPQRG